MFETVEQRFERHLVVPDLHGESELLERVLDQYDDPDIGIVSLGDIVDKKIVDDTGAEKGVRDTLEIVRQLGSRAVITIANHEYALHTAMLADDPEVRDAARDAWLGTGFNNYRVESNTLSAYDVFEHTAEGISELQERMGEAGHLQVLQAATPYYETDTFIATHGGLTRGNSLLNQKRMMETVAQHMRDRDFLGIPPQFGGDFRTAVEAHPLHNIPDLTVVSGHAHKIKPKRTEFGIQYSDNRSLHEGKRIRIASNLNFGENLFVWQDWDGEIIEIPRD